MTTGFGEEHEQFRRSLRNFVEKEIKPHIADWESEGAVPRSMFTKLGELGYLGVRLSEEYGGSGLDFWHTAVLVQELVRCGSVGVPVSILAHAEFATKVIDRVGTDEQKETFLRPAILGEKIGALGVTEPNAGSDVTAIGAKAVRDGDDYVINGEKVFITNGNIADYVTTAVRTGGPGHGGISLIIVPTDTPGFSRGRRLKKLGVHASDTAEIAFEDCRLPASYLLGPENSGFKLIMQGFEAERLVLSVMCGMQMRLMWEEACRYGHERSAFGQPLLGFQVWRHRFADVITKIEAAEALTYRAIDLYVRGVSCNAEISMAKLFSTETTLDVARQCYQIFGGYAFMDEYRIGHLFQDSLAFTIGAGTSEIMREIIARTMQLVPEGSAG
jgi:citronellyl-CoA dehydrogenase